MQPLITCYNVMSKYVYKNIMKQTNNQIYRIKIQQTIYIQEEIIKTTIFLQKPPFKNGKKHLSGIAT